MKKRYIMNLWVIIAATMFMISFWACAGNKESEELAALKKEVQMLKNKAEIQDVLWRYGLRFDLDRKDEWFEIFADDCQFTTDFSGDLVEFNGLDAIKAFYGTENWLASVRKENSGQQQDVKASSSSMRGHVEIAGIIKLDGDNAVAIGWQVGSGVRTWHLRRTNGTWLITATASRRLENKEACREIVPEYW